MTTTARSVARCYACGGTNHERVLDLVDTCLVRCRACGFHLVSPRASDESLARWLQDWAARDVVDPERLAEAHGRGASLFWRAEARRLGRLLGHRGRLLDVGCSTGAFLLAARGEGFAVTGVEAGVASSEHARRHHGLHVVTGGLLEARMEGGSQDVLTLYEVIEHVPDPLALLREAHRLLVPGGLVAISTPNLASLTARVLGARWWPINCPDEHIHLFTPATLRSLLERAGFALAGWRTFGLDPFLWARVLRGRDAGWEATSKERRTLRDRTARSGILPLLRAVKGALDMPFLVPGSPLRGAGERLFAYGVRE